MGSRLGGTSVSSRPAEEAKGIHPSYHGPISHRPAMGLRATVRHYHSLGGVVHSWVRTLRGWEFQLQSPTLILWVSSCRCKPRPARNKTEGQTSSPHSARSHRQYSCLAELARFSLCAAEMLRGSDIQHHSPGSLALGVQMLTGTELKDLQEKELGGREGECVESECLGEREFSPNSSLTLSLRTGPHAQRQQMSNDSSITQFLLLAFADTRDLQLLHFWLFLSIYLAALLGNGLIITAIACDNRLHSPMYFFLLNLSLIDLASISTTVLKSMANSLWDIRAISYAGCAAQVFLVAFLVVAEYCLLTVMAYDRYVAICQPLHYGTLLGSRACVHMAAAAWGSAFLNSLLHTTNTLSLPLCKGNAVDQFFCEIPQILKLSCSRSYLREVGLLVVSFTLAFGCFIFIMLSYVQIFRAVLRIPSEQGRHKAFSTCLPHLAVVSLFITTAMVAYLKPPSISSPSLDLVVAFLYSVVPPAMNPLIYSMRNQELKGALKKLIHSVVFQQQYAAHIS
ncbi:hypothetical protein QYF61_007012 [Mycteria americana]|uniref:G-protein coupled receptors family 1 profile domain-containing protein n=2 Tax=Mycteria americana TaxID=33587 RepID=A0AAN7N149_MYCAM|nr:hypothetical protein QYF61_007012 [Mycteria americana]